jgi:recombination protein RecR
MNFTSKLIEEAVNEFSRLPGVGKKTALRYVLHLLRLDPSEVQHFGHVLQRLKSDLKSCKVCFNISDKDLCELCSSPSRDQSLVCVVEDMRDVMAIESTHQYKGLYHVLGGIISPMDGIGPSELQIESLVERVRSGNVKEVIMALSTTMEGDTTNFYIYKKLKDLGVVLTTLARGVSVGDELEYADEITLGRSLVNRTPYENTLSSR